MHFSNDFDMVVLYHQNLNSKRLFDQRFCLFMGQHLVLLPTKGKQMDDKMNKNYYLYESKWRFGINYCCVFVAGPN